MIELWHIENVSQVRESLVLYKRDMKRRDALKTLFAAPFAARAAGGHEVRLGGPIFLKSDDPVEQAREHKRLGYSAAYCPKQLKAGDSAGISAAKRAFAAEGIVIAEAGAWVNMIDPDAAKRKKNRDYVAERLALADEIGAKCCVDIGGSFNAKLWDGPDPRNVTNEYLDATVENCRYLIDHVKPTRTKFSIEMMGWSLPNTADSYVHLIKAVDRKQFGAHVDICNVIDSAQKYYSNAKVTEEIFRKLGPWILSCHAKDVGPNATHLVETIPGRGGIDYAAYLKAIAGLHRETPLMLEHLKTAEEYDEARTYVQSVARQAGVTF